MKRKKIITITIFSIILLSPFIVKASISGDPSQGQLNQLINTTIECPILNGHPTYVGNTEYTEYIEEMWVNATDYKEMKPTDIFELGKNYRYNIRYRLKQQYIDKYISFPNFDYDKCQYTLGGGGTSGNNFIQEMKDFYIGNRDAAEWFERESATLDIDNPTLGGHPPVARGNSKYSIISQRWINTTDDKEMKSTDVFEQNKKYRYEIIFSSFYETGNFFYIFGGSEYYLGDSYNENVSISQELKKGYFYFGDKDDLVIEGSATIENVNAPKAGEKLSIPNIIVDAPIEDVYVGWQIFDEQNLYGSYISNPTEETAQVGKKYMLNISITGENGYKFADDFEIINNNKNNNFIKDSKGISWNSNRISLNYSATYQVLEEGSTIGIEANTSLIYPGDGRQFTTFPSNEYNEEITWESSNEDIASVSSDGYVTAISPGNVTITATNKKGDSASIELTIGIPVESIILNKTELTMYVGDEEQLTATILPENATDKTVHWSVFWETGMDYNDLPVNVGYNDGKVIAKKPGTTKVYAYSSSSPSAYCTITVIERPVEVEKITLDKTELKVLVNSSNTIHATITPNEASDNPITWLSSNSSIASVDQNGKVTGHKVGSVLITAKTPNNKIATCVVSVSDYFGVTFYDQDGTTIIKSTEMYEYRTPASEIVKPTNINKENLSFVGWYTEPELVNKYEFTGLIESNINLYGKWEEINAEITATPDEIDYGEVYANFTKRVQRNVIIKNTGNVDVSLSISNPTASGPFACLGFDVGKVLKPNEEYEAKLIADPGRTYSDIPGTYIGVYRVTGKYVNNEAIKSNTDITANIKILKKPIEVLYKTHVQSYGWQDYVSNGEMSGTEGEAKRLEGIKIKLENQDYDGDIEYRTHIQSYGWEQKFKKNDEMSGTSGEAKRLEAIEIKLTGELAENYDIYYRVHAQSFGWLGWARNGEQAGTASFAKRLEGIEIKIVPKNSEFEGYGEKEAFKGKSIEYTTHVQTYGWQDYAYDGNMAGTSGEAKRLEAIKIKLSNQKYTGNVEYKTHIQTYGWEKEFKKNDEMSGTSGEAKRLEAIEIKLTGEMEKHYDIYYRVHAQTYGWLAWAKNGEKSGTAGYAKRLEGIEIILVNKGEEPPVRDNQNNEKAFISFEEENQQVINYSVDDPKVSNLINNILSRTITLDYNSNALDTIYTKDVKVLTSDIESIVAYRAVEDNFIDKNVVSLDEMKNSIKKYFGKDYVFNPDTLDLNNRCAFFGYDSNTKIFTKNGGGCGSTTGPSSTYKIVKAVDINGTLKLNVKVIFANSTTKKYYSDYNKTNVISDFDEEGYSDRDEHGNHTEAYLNYLDSLLNQGSNYQFTFKLENNNYVFVSSEPIN